MTRTLSIALVVAIAAAGVQSWRLAEEQTDHAKTVAMWAKDREDRERAARQAEADSRAEEQRRTAEVQKVADEATQALELARADADAAADAGQRLRAQLATVAASCRGAAVHTGASGAGTPADATADLLANVQRRLDEAADGIARFADQSHAAGTACQRGYNALKP